MRKAILGSGLALLLVQVGFFLLIESDLQRHFVETHRNIGDHSSYFAFIGKNTTSDTMKKSVKVSNVNDWSSVDNELGNHNPMWSEARTWLIFPEHLAGAFSGGFGEQSCYSCHFDYDLNMPDGKLELKGLGDSVESGKDYELEVFISRADLGAAGFQLTARFEDGSQAGSFKLNDKVILTPNTPGDVEYLQHAIRNIEPENGSKSWKVTWTAPQDANRPIIYNLAGNAANGDESAFGDWILVREWVVGNRE